MLWPGHTSAHHAYPDWIGLLVTILFAALGCYLHLRGKTRSGWAVGDSVAENFTPADRPGENWHFDRDGHVLDRVLDRDQIERLKV